MQVVCICFSITRGADVARGCVEGEGLRPSAVLYVSSSHVREKQGGRLDACLPPQTQVLCRAGKLLP